MNGRRIADICPGEVHPPMERGDYRRVITNGLYGCHWECCTPNGLRGNLKNHEVNEHMDGTISVSPSILCEWPNRTQPKRYHGLLLDGVWETLPDTDPMPTDDPVATDA